MVRRVCVSRARCVALLRARTLVCLRHTHSHIRFAAVVPLPGAVGIIIAPPPPIPHRIHTKQQQKKATCKRFREHCAASGIALPPRGGGGFSLRYDTNVPRQAGLSGSSAIVCAGE